MASHRRSSVALYLVGQCGLGFAFAVAFATLMLITDTAGIRTLVAATSDPVASVVILLIGSGTTMIPLVLATAIGLLPAAALD